MMNAKVLVMAATMIGAALTVVPTVSAGTGLSATAKVATISKAYLAVLTGTPYKFSLSEGGTIDYAAFFPGQSTDKTTTVFGTIDCAIAKAMEIVECIISSLNPGAAEDCVD